MPSRRRKTSGMSAQAGKKLTATAEPDVKEDAVQVESQPVITQVVEVIEEEIPVGDPSPSGDTHAEEVSESEARKEKVEELYHGTKEPPVMPEISVHKGRSIRSIVVWAIITILVALATGGILFAIAKKTSPLTLFAKPSPTPTVTPAPTPTPEPVVIDKTSFEIKVLNGGGTPGAAGKMKTFLEDKGYTVSGTGNTEEYTYTATEIHGKETMKDAIANLEADLKDAYSLGAVAADLPASASADVEVIVGK